MGEGVDELLDALAGGLGCAGAFPGVAGGELLGGLEVAEVVSDGEIVRNSRFNASTGVQQK